MVEKKKRGDSKIILFFLLFIIFLLILIISIYFFTSYYEKITTCGDKTLNNKCSLRKPYFCLNGTLVEEASLCSCPEILTKKEDSCISEYQTNPKEITLKYVLRGEEKKMDLVVYEGMVDYISDLPKSIYYSGGEQPSRADFKLRNINEEEQRELLLPLVTEIQNIAYSKEDQARIAISIVQKIPFGKSGGVVEVGENQADYSQYSYEVLYNMQGVCGEKSELLAFLLKEIGYSVVVFYYPVENHEAVGIKCPMKYSLYNTGYCFVETTGSSIITDNQNKYIGAELLSEPEIILISDGISLRNDLYEYKDAKTWANINKIIEQEGRINLIENFKYKRLKEKYGLE